MEPMDLPFELDSSIITALKLLNQKIDEEITKKLIVNAIKQLLVEGSGKQYEIYQIDSN